MAKKKNPPPGDSAGNQGTPDEPKKDKVEKSPSQPASAGPGAQVPPVTEPPAEWK